MSRLACRVSVSRLMNEAACRASVSRLACRVSVSRLMMQHVGRV